MDLSPPAFLAAAVAATIVGFAKGGFGGVGVVVAVPIMSLAMSPAEALGVLLPVLMLGDVIAVSGHRAAVDRAAIVAAVPGAALGVALGALLLALVDGAPITALIGLVAILFALHSLRGVGVAGGIAGGATRLGDPRLAPFAGLVSGITSTLAHAGGPPIHIHLLARGYAPVVFVATASVFMAVVNLMKVLPYVLLGNFDLSTLAVSATLVPFAATAAFAGVRLARRIERRLFARAVNTLMLLVGAKLLADGVGGMLG